MNRSRTNHLLKIEKENENKDIKIKQKMSQPRGPTSVLTNATSSNADKVSQNVGKQSTKYVGGRSKSLHNNDSHTISSYQQGTKRPLSTTSTHRTEHFAESTDCYVKSMGIFPNHKRLSPYMAPTPGPKPRLGHRQQKSTDQAVSPSSHRQKLHEDPLSAKSCTNKHESVMSMYSPCSTADLEDFSYKTKDACSTIPLMEPLSAASNRSCRNWKKSESARLDYISPKSRPERLSICSGSSVYLNLDLDFCSLGSPSCENEIFYMAPLLSVPNSTYSSDSGASLERKFRHALNVSQSCMEDDDIKVVKKVLKTDKRHSLLQSENADPNVFKDILKTQLDDIIRNEKVIKSALVKLGASHEVDSGSSNELIEIADLRSPSKKKFDDENSRHKSKKRRRSIEVQPSSEESSPERRRRSIFEVQEIETLSDDMSARLAQPSKPHYEKHYLYSQKEEGNLKLEKYRRSKDANTEYEEFVKNALSFKQKAAHKRENSPISVIQSQSQIQMQLDVQNFSEGDDQKPKSKTASRPQVNVTFKNVASLEKEIIILRALGDRLEATLKRTVSEPSLYDLDKKQDMYTSSSMSSLTKELQKIDSSMRIYPGRRFVERCFGFVRRMDVLVWTEQRVEYFILTIGLRYEFGIANEFVIVSKTIDELRCDASSSFYIPKSGQLLCTSFENLKREPDLFLQILKPKTAGQPFNLLDHDPIFFNNLLKKPAFKTETIENTKPEVLSNDGISKENVTICEGGDSMVAASEGIKNTRKKLMIKTNNKRASLVEKRPSEEDKVVPEQVGVEKEQTPESSKSIEISKQSAPFSVESGSSVPILSARRSRIRRLVTPMPFDAFDEPKNTLLKKVLIGVIQVSIFMGLIMALTLPDIKC